MRLFLSLTLLFSLASVALAGKGAQQKNQLKKWETAPEAEKELEFLDKLPTPLVVQFPSGVQGKIGDTVHTEDMREKPISNWKGSKNKYYTYLILDTGPSYIHYLGVNIKGDNWDTVQDAFCYIPPFYFERNEDASGLVLDGDGYNQHLHVVLEQPGYIDLPKSDFPQECGCENPLGGRVGIVTPEILVNDFDMTVVAAGSIFIPYSPASLQMLCEYDQFCNSPGFPYLSEPVEGVNEDPRVCTEPDYLLEEIRGGWAKAETAEGFLPGGEIPAPLHVTFPSGVEARSGQVVYSADMLEKPDTTLPVSEDESEDYFTYMLLDASVPYLHWLAVNIKGGDWSTAEDAFCFIPSYSLFFKEDNSRLIFNDENVHEHMHMVFKQEGYIDLATSDFPQECGCEDVLQGRFGTITPDTLVSDFGMTVVAGSVILNPSSEEIVIQILCEFDYFCNAPGLPYLNKPLAGVNMEPRVCSDGPVYLTEEIYGPSGAWKESFEDELVTQDFDQAPESPLVVKFGDLFVVPGIRVHTEEMWDAPTSFWEADDKEFYTYLLEDTGVPLAHFLMVNIPGNRMEEGEVVFHYLPSFSLNFNEQDEFVNEDVPDYYHAHVHMVFRQNKKVKINKTDIEKSLDCTDLEWRDKRVAWTHATLLDELALDPVPVAGQVVRVGYDLEAVRELSCKYSSDECTGQTWPFELPGVTDTCDEAA